MSAKSGQTTQQATEGLTVKIHGNTITADDIARAAHAAGVGLTNADTRGSRIRSHAFEVYLSGSSGHRSQRDSEARAATWDEWGVFLGSLFDADESLTVPGVYESAEHYHWSTGGRFRSHLPASARHKQHKWEFDGTAVTGAYHVSTCKCGALRRFMAHGRKFDELALS